MHTLANDPISSWERLFPYQPHRIRLSSGPEMAFVDEGSGRNLLMVHGNPTWSFYFHPLVNSLRNEFRCLAIDHVGCGRSDKPQTYQYNLGQHIENLVQFIDDLDLQQTTLVAHDWGGAIGMGAVRLRPDRFSKIVLLNTAAFPPPFFPLRIRACRFPILGNWAMRQLNVFGRAAIRMATERPKGLDQDVAAGLLAPYDNWRNRVAISRFVQDIPTRPTQPTWQTLKAIESFLPTLSIPKLLVWGMRDWCFRPECLDRFLQHWPEAKSVRIAKAGHYVLLDAADQVTTAIRQFAQE